MIGLNSKIFIAGHKGLVGSAILRKLKSKGYKNLLTIDKKKLDLTDQRKVFRFLKFFLKNYIFFFLFYLVLLTQLYHLNEGLL